MNKPILFLLGLLFVASCTEQNDEPTHQAKQPEVQHNSPTRTPQEAQNEVADFLAAMGKKTRSATRPTIANVGRERIFLIMMDFVWGVSMSTEDCI